jgi:pimeloyl-ACP methyl ester carboxylesterase
MTKPKVYIVHGQGQTPQGSIARLAGLLNTLGYETECPLFPHTDPRDTGLSSIDVLNTVLGSGPAFVVGLGLGGFVAAKLQETRQNMTVIAVSAPDISGYITLGPPAGGRRVYMFSSIKDSVIRGKTARWAGQAEVYDLPKLDHHDTAFLPFVVSAVEAVSNGTDLHTALLGAATS